MIWQPVSCMDIPKFLNIGFEHMSKRPKLAHLPPSKVDELLIVNRKKATPND